MIATLLDACNHTTMAGSTGSTWSEYLLLFLKSVVDAQTLNKSQQNQ